MTAFLDPQQKPMKASKKQTNDIEHTHRDDIPPRLATRLELLGRKLQGLAVLLQGLVDENGGGPMVLLWVEQGAK